MFAWMDGKISRWDIDESVILRPYRNTTYLYNRLLGILQGILQHVNLS